MAYEKNLQNKGSDNWVEQRQKLMWNDDWHMKEWVSGGWDMDEVDGGKIGSKSRTKRNPNSTPAALGKKVPRFVWLWRPKPFKTTRRKSNLAWEWAWLVWQRSNITPRPLPWWDDKELASTTSAWPVYGHLFSGIISSSQGSAKPMSCSFCLGFITFRSASLE